MTKIDQEDLDKLRAANIKFQDSEVELARVSHQEEMIKRKKTSSISNYDMSLSNRNHVHGDIIDKYKIREDQSINWETGEIVNKNE